MEPVKSEYGCVPAFSEWMTGMTGYMCMKGMHPEIFPYPLITEGDIGQP